MQFLATLFLTLALPAWAADSASPWATFERIRQGVRPTLEFESDFALAKSDLISRSLAFDRLLKVQLKTGTPYCAEFVKVTRHVLSSLNETMDHFKDPSLIDGDAESVLAHARLMLSIPFVEALHQMFTHGRDGGYGTIDLRPIEVCEYRDRDAIDRDFAELSRRYDAFRTAALGAPGVMPLEDLTDRLLVLADQQQSRFDNVTLAVAVGTLVADIALWNVAPLWIAGKGLARIGKFALLGFAEGVGFRLVDVFGNPEPEQRASSKAPSWGQLMRDIDALAESSFEQPQLYLAYVTSVQARLSAMVGAWVQANQAEINRAVPR